MRNIKLTIAYDGTGFSGWQKQLNAPTIQGKLEKVLSTITNCTVTLNGAGRTDAGVHALGMVANFKSNSSISLPRLQTGANSILPAAIRILGIEAAHPDFHARFTSLSKSYTYTIETGAIQSPIGRLYAVHIPQSLSLSSMQQCLKIITGTHDFASFEASGSRDKTVSTGKGSVRTLYSATLTENAPDQLQFQFTGDGFLRHMVRNMVGSVLEVGKGRKTVADFIVILDARDRSKACATAPAHGLFLEEINYPPT